MKKKGLLVIKKYLGVILLILVFLAFTKPYLLNGQIPYPSSHLVTLMAPWNSDGKFSTPVKNNAIPDTVTQLYPWKYYTTHELKRGRLPMWNPYIFSGTPHLANYQTSVFSVTTPIFFLLPFIDAWTLSILLQPLVAGVGMYLLLRKLTISQLGSVVSSITFMFCGFLVVWMPYGTLSLAVAFLPFILFGIESFFQTKKKKFLIITAVSIVFSLFSGHFQTSLYVLLFSGFYAIFKLLGTKNLRDSLSLGAAFLLGLLLALPQLLPTLHFYEESLRATSSIVDKGIPFWYLITSIIPDFFGNPVTRNDWVSFYAERASFIGIIPFVLSLFAIIYKRNKMTTFFLSAGLISLLFAIDSPLQSLLAVSHIPVLSASNPARIIVLFSFAFSVLAGIGFDTLSEFIKSKKQKKLMMILIPVLGLLLLQLFFLKLSLLLPIDKGTIAVRNSLLPIGLLVFFTFAILLATNLKIKLLNVVIPIVIVILIAIDSLRFAKKWVPTDDKKYLYPQIAVIDALQKVKKDGRVFQALGAETQLIYSFKGIEGYDSLFLGRYAEFIQSAKSGMLGKTERTTVRLDRDGVGSERVLDMLNVTTIFHPVSFNNQSYAYPVWEKPEKYNQIYKDDTFELYRNNTAEPRVKLYFSYEVINDKEALIKRFYDKDFSFRTILLLETEPNIKINKEGSGKAVIISETPEKIIIQTESSSNALLFLADPYYKGWQVKINGQKDSILPADYAFRAVQIPKGKATVEFYLPLF